MDSIRQSVVENLRSVAFAPSVQMHDVPQPWKPLENRKDEPDPEKSETAEERAERYVNT